MQCVKESKWKQRKQDKLKAIISINKIRMIKTEAKNPTKCPAIWRYETRTKFFRHTKIIHDGTQKNSIGKEEEIINVKETLYD